MPRQATTKPDSSTGTIGFEVSVPVRKDLANGSMSSNQSGECDIRRALIEADLVDCMVALPGQLFYSTQIPVCPWFLAINKAADAERQNMPELDLAA